MFRLTSAARELFNRNNLYDRDAYRELFAEAKRAMRSGPPTPSNDFDRAQVGAWDEFLGDFAVLSGPPESATEAYDAARGVYTEAEGFGLGFAEREHRDLIRFYEDLALACGEDLDDWYDWKTELSFPEWIDHKRERLPSHHEALIKRGTWR